VLLRVGEDRDSNAGGKPMTRAAPGRLLYRYCWEEDGELIWVYFPAFKKAQLARELKRTAGGCDVGEVERIRLKPMAPYYQLIESLNDIEGMIMESEIVLPARETHQGNKRRRLAEAS